MDQQSWNQMRSLLQAQGVANPTNQQINQRFNQLRNQQANQAQNQAQKLIALQRNGRDSYGAMDGILERFKDYSPDQKLKLAMMLRDAWGWSDSDLAEHFGEDLPPLPPRFARSDSSGGEDNITKEYNPVLLTDRAKAFAEAREKIKSGQSRPGTQMPFQTGGYDGFGRGTINQVIADMRDGTVSGNTQQAIKNMLAQSDGTLGPALTNRLKAIANAPGGAISNEDRQNFIESMREYTQIKPATDPKNYNNISTSPISEEYKHIFRGEGPIGQVKLFNALNQFQAPGTKNGEWPKSITIDQNGKVLSSVAHEPGTWGRREPPTVFVQNEEGENIYVYKFGGSPNDKRPYTDRTALSISDDYFGAKVENGVIPNIRDHSGRHAMLKESREKNRSIKTIMNLARSERRNLTQDEVDKIYTLVRGNNGMGGSIVSLDGGPSSNDIGSGGFTLSFKDVKGRTHTTKISPSEKLKSKLIYPENRIGRHEGIIGGRESQPVNPPLVRGRPSPTENLEVGEIRSIDPVSTSISSPGSVSRITRPWFPPKEYPRPTAPSLRVPPQQPAVLLNINYQGPGKQLLTHVAKDMGNGKLTERTIERLNNFLASSNSDNLNPGLREHLTKIVSTGGVVNAQDRDRLSKFLQPLRLSRPPYATLYGNPNAGPKTSRVPQPYMPTQQANENQALWNQAVAQLRAGGVEQPTNQQINQVRNQLRNQYADRAVNQRTNAIDKLLYQGVGSPTEEQIAQRMAKFDAVYGGQDGSRDSDVNPTTSDRRLPPRPYMPPVQQGGESQTLPKRPAPIKPGLAFDRPATKWAPPPGATKVATPEANSKETVGGYEKPTWLYNGATEPSAKEKEIFRIVNGALEQNRSLTQAEQDKVYELRAGKNYYVGPGSYGQAFTPDGKIYKPAAVPKILMTPSAGSFTVKVQGENEELHTVKISPSAEYRKDMVHNYDDYATYLPGGSSRNPKTPEAKKAFEDWQMQSSDSGWFTTRELRKPRPGEPPVQGFDKYTTTNKNTRKVAAILRKAQEQGRQPTQKEEDTIYTLLRNNSLGGATYVSIDEKGRMYNNHVSKRSSSFEVRFDNAGKKSVVQIDASPSLIASIRDKANERPVGIGTFFDTSWKTKHPIGVGDINEKRKNDKDINSSQLDKEERESLKAEASRRFESLQSNAAGTDDRKIASSRRLTLSQRDLIFGDNNSGSASPPRQSPMHNPFDMNSMLHQQ